MLHQQVADTTSSLSHLHSPCRTSFVTQTKRTMCKFHTRSFLYIAFTLSEQLGPQIAAKRYYLEQKGS